MVTATAPGKVHLIGEHAVVYGEPAFIAAVGRRIQVQVQRSAEVSYLDRRFDTEPDRWPVDEVLRTADELTQLWQACKDKGDFSPLFARFKADRYRGYRQGVVGIALRQLGLREGVAVEISGGVPVGSGLGSSSSLAVALAQGMAALFGKALSKEAINAIAYDMEKIVHGSPSGGDNTACCYGGVLWFEKGSPNKMVPLQLPPLEGVVLVHTGTPQKTTGELVQMVRNLDPAFREPRVKAIGQATREMHDALQRQDHAMIKDLINRAQEHLRELGVSTPLIDSIAAQVRAIGGAAKLCGAGGGGFMLCYHEDTEKVKEIARAAGGEPLQVPLGVEGVRVE